jgi:HAD superfamily hydrolase (TIGR01509 family)
MADRFKGLIFDCDGVLADTERDGHRVAFNRAFADKGYGFEWDVALYKELLKVGGGKERMKHYFEQTSWPAGLRPGPAAARSAGTGEAGMDDKNTLLKELHEIKTAHYMQIIESGQLPLRPGVARLVDEAIAASVRLAVCSTSNERSVNAVVERLLGPQRKARFDVILAGDIVSKKKPDPEIYNLVLDRLHLRPSECVVVEDNRNGLLAAKDAGMHCVVTTNEYTRDEDFAEADLVVSELGDPPNVQVDLARIRSIVERC